MDQEATTILERFSSVTPDEFEQQITSLWKASEKIVNSVVNQVKSGDIPVMTGLGIISCVAGQTFGYGYAHGQPASADLYASLTNGLEQNRRQPIGAR